MNQLKYVSFPSMAVLAASFAFLITPAAFAAETCADAVNEVKAAIAEDTDYTLAQLIQIMTDAMQGTPKSCIDKVLDAVIEESGADAATAEDLGDAAKLIAPDESDAIDNVVKDAAKPSTADHTGGPGLSAPAPSAPANAGPGSTTPTGGGGGTTTKRVTRTVVVPGTMSPTMMMPAN